jgi:hypothetical protein
MTIPVQDPQTLLQTINAFFEGDKLQKERFRLYIAYKLNSIHQELEYYVLNPTHETLWKQVGDLTAITNQELLHLAYKRIVNLHTTVDFWQQESVETAERFEFFIRTKAAEISSGNMDQDYYDALMIRNDQLLASCDVFSQCLDHIKACVTLPASEVITSPNFLFFADKDIDTLIYETAERYYEVRRSMKDMGLTG